MAIKGIILTSGLIGNINITQIQPNDRAIPTVANKPHQDLYDVCVLFNEHHNNNLTHFGNFTLVGNFTILGVDTDFNVSEWQTTDPTIDLNNGGISATASGGGLSIAPSSANPVGLYYDPNKPNKWVVDLNGTLKEVATFETSGTLLTGSPVQSNSLVPYDEANIDWGISTSSITCASSSIDLSVKASVTLGVVWKAPHVLTRNYWSAASGNMNGGRTAPGGCGSQNYALCFGGASASDSANSEIYNGDSWSLTSSIVTARQGLRGVGVVNAAIGFGGWEGSTYSDHSEKFDGTTWSNTGFLNTARAWLSGGGTRNSALSVGGNISGAVASAVTERFDGASWVAAASMSTARPYGGGCPGVVNSLIYPGGTTSGTTSEIYNGITNVWTSGPAIAAVKFSNGSAGTLYNAIIFGGGSAGSESNTSQGFDGVSWVTKPNIPSATTQPGPAGTADSALMFGGYLGGSYKQSTYKWFGVVPLEIKIYDETTKDTTKDSIFISSPQNVTVEVGWSENTGLTFEDKTQVSELGKLDYGDGKWTAISDMSTNHYGGAGFGTQRAFFVCGGGTYTTSGWESNEKWDGSSWSSMTTGNTLIGGKRGFGHQNSAVVCGGLTSAGTMPASGIIQVETQIWDGNSWSNTGNMNVPRTDHGVSGITNSGLTVGGISATANIVGVAEVFNGTTWANISSCSMGRGYTGACGKQQATLVVGGYQTGGSILESSAEIYNGNSWVTAASMNLQRYAMATHGILNASMISGGASGSGGSDVYNRCEKYNGISFLFSGTMITARRWQQGGGTQMSAIVAGGRNSETSGDMKSAETFNSEFILPGTIANLTY